MRYFVCFLYLTIFLLKSCCAIDEDAKLAVPDIIVKYGYPAEEHHVTTDDGYILTLHRIPYGKNGSSTDNKPIVFLQHGILASSHAWLMLGPNKALAYLLADKSYDVWMGNSRGNTYSKKHVKLNATGETRRKYWNFSFHELGVYDLSASIDYILALTKQTKLSYIGHSQGCVIFFVLCSEKPEYNNKINAFFAMAPGVFLSNIISLPFKIGVAIENFHALRILTSIIGSIEVLPHNDQVSTIAGKLCSDKSQLQIVCVVGYNLISGYNPKETNATSFPVLFGHFPAGCSSKQLTHYFQEANSGKFRRYDYGWITNTFYYGTDTPPEYNLKKTTVPVYIYYGENDWLVQPEDVMLLKNEIVNLKGLIKIADDGWAHNDFTYGKHADFFVYNILISDLTSYNTV